MPSPFISVLVILTGLALILFCLFLYIRSRQGEQRAINTLSQVLLPVLSAIVITINLLFTARRATLICSGTITTLLTIGTIAIVALIVLSCIRFFSSCNRDRRVILHATLFSAIIVIAMLMLSYFYGCF